MDFPVLNKCPGYNLYIGGFIALRRPKALQNCRITHIVSVLDWHFEAENPLTRGYQHLHIPVDDVEDENLLTWFPQSNAFIHDALTHWRPSNESLHGADGASIDILDSERRNGVLIHCAMGKSRSATVLLAYLLWSSRQPSSTPLKGGSEDDSMVSIPRKSLSVIDALTLLRQGRPIAEPNEGFMDQLYLYVDMGCPTTQSQLDSHKLYRRWMNKRNVEESLRINRAPDMVDILFEDESPDEDEDLPAQTAKLSVKSEEDQQKVAPGISAPSGMTPPSSEIPSSSETTIKCRRCRHLLARSAFIIPHEPSRGDPSSTTCARIFLHPLSWMKEALAEGQLEGRLTCPNKKCGQNVGKFAWQGLRCNCGRWVTPGFGVARGKVDEVTMTIRAESHSNGGNEEGMGSPGGGALRLPPGMRKQGKI